MPKTNFSSRVKIAFLNAMQALGAAASHLASNAKLRVNEINLESRRHEILTEFSLQAFEMWHNGVKLPKELADMFEEISEIDDKLSILRAQKYAKVNVECEVVSADGEDAIPTECSIDVPNEPVPAEEPTPEAAPEPAPDADADPAADSAPAQKPKRPRSGVRKSAKAGDKPKE